MGIATKVADLTGPGRTDRFGMGGTDLGAAALAPDGRIAAVFGDTFERAGVGGPGWRSPVVLFADPGSVATGLVWTGSAGPGDYAHQVVDYVHGGLRGWRRVSTVLPTDVITLGDEMYLHVMACKGLGNVRRTELHRSTDSGRTWEPTATTWPGGHHGGLFQMITWEAGDDGWVYAYSTSFQRSHGLLLHRVPAGRVTDPTAWEGWGWDGTDWGWGRPPTIVLSGAYGELSLRRVPGPGGPVWALVVFDAGNYRMDVRLLGHPTDDLYRAPTTTLLDGCGWHDEDHDADGRVAQLYGGYVVPGSTLADLHVVVSQWNTGTGWPYRAMQFRASLV